MTINQVFPEEESELFDEAMTIVLVLRARLLVLTSWSFLLLPQPTVAAHTED